MEDQMKKVLVLGSGMVAKPFVDEMLEQGHAVTCIDMDEARAKELVGKHPKGKAVGLEIAKGEKLDAYIEAHDLVCSLLPPPFHPKIAKRCLNFKTNLVTTSYLSDDMKALHKDAKKAGLIFLNETGLDPGLDHMAAMDLKGDVEEKGGTVVGFQSHCGGFPAPSAANNPIRYKFSWNPSGVLGALQRESSFMVKEKVYEIPGEGMLSRSEPIYIPGEGIFETTPNGNGLFYAAKYGLKDCKTIRRGTLRYPGWARFWTFALKMGWLDRTETVEVKKATPIQILNRLCPWSDKRDFIEFVFHKSPKQASHILEVCHSLGFFDDKLTGTFSAFDIFLNQTQKYWVYGAKEVDKVILYNHFEVAVKGQHQTWTSVLAMEGDPKGDSAMSRLVGLPCAIAGLKILDGTIKVKGVHIPLQEEIFRPILKGLKAKGIVFDKRSDTK